MVVGYSLGNKNTENDIQVLGETDPNVITFSTTLEIALTNQCRNACGHYPFRGDRDLKVPYSTINKTKQSRSRGTREAFYITGERPDKDPKIRSLLNLWGFNTYADYIYTVVELGFLEGLIPVIEAGLSSIDELKKYQEISALYKIMLTGVNENSFTKGYSKHIEKQLEYRLKMLEWAGKLGFSVIAGFVVGIGETKTLRKDMLKQIAKLHQTYGHIHEVLLQNYIPHPNAEWKSKPETPHKLMIETVELAHSILPSDISVTVPIHLNKNIPDFIKAGIRDFGRIPESRSILFPQAEPLDFENLVKLTNKAGFELQQRFPLKHDFIKEGRYSKKLGQVFDAYRYKIKKADQAKGG